MCLVVFYYQNYISMVKSLNMTTKFTRAVSVNGYVSNFEKAVRNFEQFLEEEKTHQSASLKVLFAGK